MFEEILNNHLRKCSDITSYLTKYDDEPAIFNQTAPDDMSDLWNDNVQYGRIVFFANMQSDTERKISGTVEIDVYLQDTSEIEAIAETVKTNVDGYFFSGKSETTILAKWNSTRYVDVADKKITVAAVLFTLLAFPNQQTCEPDPIKLVNEWTRKLLPDVRLIGYDEDIPTVWKPQKDIPAVYWRKSKVGNCERIPSMYAGDWYTAVMNAHIFTEDIAVSNAIASMMCTKLNQKKVLQFPDGTWMRVDNNNQLQPGTDELRVGQLSVEGDYCVLRKEPDSELLKHIKIND